MRWPRYLLLVLLLSLGCKPADSDIEPRKVSGPKQSPTLDDEPPTGVVLAAAGVEITVPSDWTILTEDDPNFALAFVHEPGSSYMPVCSVELRRQGVGSLPDGARERDGGHEYQRGHQRGRIQSLPGPDGSTIVVHCRAAKSSKLWTPIHAVMASVRELEAKPALAGVHAPTGPDAVLELCAGSPARLTTICARTAGGAVYCGSSLAEALDRVALERPAVQISCIGATGCARDAEGGVLCWDGAGKPERIGGLAGARSIVGNNVVAESGRLVQRGQLGLSEVIPFEDPTLALTEVEQVLAGTHAMSGCVLRDGAQLWCWDAERRLHELEHGFAGASELRRDGDRVCVGTDGRWVCLDPDGQRHELDGCATRACGCSLLGASRFSCEDQPIAPIDARPLGRLANVVVVAEPCAALADGSVVCRGAAASATTSSDPGAVHRLTLHEPGG